MLTKIFISLIILGFFFTIPACANLQQQLSTYYENTRQLADLNATKAQIENNMTELNKSIEQSINSTTKLNANINIYNSEIGALEKTIQENKLKKAEIDRNIQAINILNKKESLIIAGTSSGMIAGLWAVCLFLVLLWRK